MELFSAAGEKKVSHFHADLLQSFQAVGDKRRTGDGQTLNAPFSQANDFRRGGRADPLRRPQTRLKGCRPHPAGEIQLQRQGGGCGEALGPVAGLLFRPWALATIRRQQAPALLPDLGLRQTVIGK